MLKRIAEQDGVKYETAVYAVQCSNLKRILPICTDWEVYLYLSPLKVHFSNFSFFFFYILFYLILIY